MMMRNKKDRVFSRGVEIEVCKRPDPKIRLYDYRLIQREPLQSYEGNVNSHTRIQLGVDPYERFFMSGEEDCNLRLWSIKSSELLFEDNFMDFVPSIVCWLKGTDLGAALALHNQVNNFFLGKAKAPLELVECASSYNPNKVISGFAKPGFLNQNGVRTKDVGKSHSKCSSSSSPTFEERVGNHLDKDVMVLNGSGDFNHCNGDSGAFVISDEGISYISGDDQQLAGKTSSYKEELRESETTPEKIRTDSEKPRATRRSSMRVLMSCGFCSASSSLSMMLGLMGCWVVVFSLLLDQ